MALKSKADLHKIIHSWVHATPSVWGGGGGDPPCLETQCRATDCGLAMKELVVGGGERRDTGIVGSFGNFFLVAVNCD